MENTMISTYPQYDHPTIPVFLKAAGQAMTSLVVRKGGRYDHDVNARIQGILNRLEALSYLTGQTPETYFEMVAYGHFKEVYRTDLGLVLKFCSARNPTIDEIELTAKAEKAGFAQFFLPSEYITLPKLMESAKLDPDDEGQYAYDEINHKWDRLEEWMDWTQFTHLCIQPEVTTYGDLPNEKLYHVIYDSSYKECKLKMWHGDLLDRDIMGVFDGVPTEWVRQMLTIHGMEGTYAFAKWCSTERVYDMHSDNVGLYDHNGLQYPVIIDWLSK